MIAFYATMISAAVVGLAATIVAATIFGLRTGSLVFLLCLVLAAVSGALIGRIGRERSAGRGARRGPLLWLYAVLAVAVAGAALAGVHALDRAERAREPAVAKPDPHAVRQAPREIVVRRLSARLGAPDPGEGLWNDVPRYRVALVAQPMVTPRPARTLTEAIELQVAHDGETIAFRMSWPDPDRSEGGRLGEFSDALAIQFPRDGSNTTPVWMGSKEQPVHLYHWRAQYQRDHEHGKPTMRDLYPNIAIDMYPMDFEHAPGGTHEDKIGFSPGLAEGNPQSHPKESVDEIIAEGFATSAVIEGHSGAARGLWDDGRWALVITRPLAVVGGSDLYLDGLHYVAFAVWQGGEKEVGARKSVTMAWQPIRVSRR